MARASKIVNNLEDDGQALEQQDHRVRTTLENNDQELKRKMKELVAQIYNPAAGELQHFFAFAAAANSDHNFLKVVLEKARMTFLVAVGRETGQGLGLIAGLRSAAATTGDAGCRDRSQPGGCDIGNNGTSS